MLKKYTRKVRFPCGFCPVSQSKYPKTDRNSSVDHTRVIRLKAVLSGVPVAQELAAWVSACSLLAGIQDRIQLVEGDPRWAILDDLRHAARALRANPGFTIVAVLTLALGIGANTAIFSVVYAALLRPLPYREPSMLYSLGESREQLADIRLSQVSNPDYQDWRKRVKSFSSLAAYSGDAFSVRIADEPKNVFAEQVTASFFSTLGVKPLLGRDFVDSDVQTDGPHVAIVSYRFWQSDFGGDKDVVGRVVRMDNVSGDDYWCPATGFRVRACQLLANLGTHSPERGLDFAPQSAMAKHHWTAGAWNLRQSGARGNGIGHCATGARISQGKRLDDFCDEDAARHGRWPGATAAADTLGLGRVCAADRLRECG